MKTIVDITIMPYVETKHSLMVTVDYSDTHEKNLCWFEFKYSYKDDLKCSANVKLNNFKDVLYEFIEVHELCDSGDYPIWKNINIDLFESNKETMH